MTVKKRDRTKRQAAIKETIDGLTALTRFIKHVERECKKHKVKFYLINKPEITEANWQGQGYFDETRRVLKVATGETYERWVGALVHEFGHFLQWRDGLFKGADSLCVNGIYAGTILERALNGHAYEGNAVQQAVDLIIENERDCEMRAVELIEKFKLDIDVKTYIKKANVQLLHFQEAVRFGRDTLPGIGLCDNPALWKKMPANFHTLDYYDAGQARKLANFRPLFFA